jgi:hypothetical protein
VFPSLAGGSRYDPPALSVAIAGELMKGDAMQISAKGTITTPFDMAQVAPLTGRWTGTRSRADGH